MKFLKRLFKKYPKVKLGEDVPNHPKNEMNFYFKDAIEKGIVTSKPVFSINGVHYHTLLSLGDQVALRYFTYQEQLRFWSNTGINKEVSQDYLNEVRDLLEEIRSNADDKRFVLEKAQDAISVCTLYNTHLDQFNVVGAMLDMCSIVYLMPCENPYDIDFEGNIFKIKEWTDAMLSDTEGELVAFFTRRFSSSEFSWMRRLIELTNSTQGKSLREEERNRAENSLLLDTLKQKKHLELLLQGKHGLSHARSLRVLFQLAKWKLNQQVSSSFLNI